VLLGGRFQWLRSATIATVVNPETCRWRLASPEDDEAVVEMSLALYEDDPGSRPVLASQIRATLARFREEPLRGRTVVLDHDGHAAGYALLVSFWSNELGGEICTIDEIYVRPAWRCRGCGSRLIASLSSDRTLWPAPPVAFELEVSPDNHRALDLYERLGFRLKRNRTLRRTGVPA
jgi:ribosomal protein S18 acetylase RimI-like enzyme